MARDGRGFSMVELVWAVMVLGLLTAMSLPSFVRWRSRIEVAGARDVFASLHARTRVAALEQGRVARLHVDGERGRVWVTVDRSERPDAAATPRPPDAWVDLASEFSGVQLTSNRRVLCFGPHGLPVAGDGCDLPNATLEFRRGAVADTITISLVGRLSKR